MARVELASQAWGWLVDSNGNQLANTSATLKNLDGTNATTWSAVTGGTSSTSALTSNADGTLSRFVEEGTYDLTVGATTRRVEARSGSDLAASYGVRADGSTDDSTGFQAYVTAMAGRVCPLPTGTVLLSAVITVPSGTVIQGRGRDLTTLKVANSASVTGGLLQATDTTGVEITDLTIDCNAANTTSLADDTKQQAVYVVTSTASGTKRFALRRVLIKNAERVGFYATNSSTSNTHEVTLEDVVVQDCGRQGVLVARPSRLRVDGLTLERNGTVANDTDQLQVGINATDGGSNIVASGVRAVDGGRNGITFLGVTDFQLVSPYAKGNGVTAAIAAQGHGIVVSEGCRDWTITAPRALGNYAINLTVDPRTAASATLKDCEGTVVGGVLSGSVTSHGGYTQYAKGVRWVGTVTRGNADDGLKLVSCQNVYADVTALGNTDRGVSVVDGTGTGSGPGGKNYVRAHCAGNGTDTVEDTGTSKSEVLVAGRRGWEVLAQSAVAATVNTGTAEVALATVSLPANTLGPNGRVRVTTLWTVTNSANNKTMRVRFGGTGGDVYQAVIATTSATVRLQTEWANRNSVSSQVGPATALTGGWGVGTGAVITGAKNTAAAQDIVISGQPASAGETITLESYVIEVLPL